MDIKDVSDDSHYVNFLKQIMHNAEQAGRRKGQAVNDHPSPSQLISSFRMKLMAKSFRPPSQQYEVATTQVPAPYLPCIVPVQDLEPISISNMRLETHHRGKKVMLRVLTPADRMTAVMAMVEDEDGTALLLQIYHQPVETVVPADEILYPGRVCILKEPFFKCATGDGSYSLRVDHPSDVIWLDESDARVPSKWKPSRTIAYNNSASIRSQGNHAVEEENWAEAFKLYSAAIQTAQTPEEKQLAFLNRSLTNLRLCRPEGALSDAKQGTNPATPSEKSLFREARALYMLAQYEQSLEKLQQLAQTFPKNKAVGPEQLRIKARLDEARNGNYSFKRMYKESKKTPPLIDCATFSAAVEVGNSPGRGRGLFTTKPVSAGDLLLCEKAFSYSFAGDEQSTKRTNILMNLATKKMTMGGQALLWTQVVQKLFNNSTLSEDLQDLHHADYPKVAVSDCDGIPIVDSFLVEKIISLNAFGAPRTSQQSFLDSASLNSNLEKDTGFKYTTSGIWLLASRINHSCVGNCRRSFIGDMQIVRATRDLPAGTELFFCYRAPIPLESYDEAQKGLANWGFKCGCELCVDRKATLYSALQKRKRIIKDIATLFDNPGIPSPRKARRFIEKLEETYPEKGGSSVRLELPEPCFALASVFATNNQQQKAVEMIVKGLGALGYSLTACLPGDPADAPRLEVKRWGIGNESVPWAFFNLSKAYRQIAPQLCSVAENYAGLSYGIVVGERETCRDVFPGVG
ncbi:hypothetical protein FZEAL_312 [Fusarium zealandicum]|uniref:SET domain-containing protein n=1 Tax=Fusarium zealandicum TaxID=1053134 RepID=A0A8H4XQF2_9HYPO|nr:hypothetical protein FZEAL_312 [Fusarium zealandicum]